MNIPQILQEFGILFLIISSGVTFLLGYLTLKSDAQNATKKIFFSLCVVIPIWLFIFTLSTRPDLITENYWLTLMRLSLVFAVPVNILFLLLANTFPSSEVSISRRQFSLWAIIFFLMIIIVASPLTFVSVSLDDVNTLKPVTGPGMLIFALFNFVCYFLTFSILYRRMRHTIAQEERKALLMLGGGMFLMISLMFFTISLPVALYNFTNFVPFAPLYALLFVIFITYGVIKHQLFNAKVLAAQIFVFILSIVFFAKTVSSNTATGDRIVDGSTFIAITLFGFLLVRSVKEEVRSREKIQDLAKRLTEANWELAKTNEQLRIIDQRKSEFVSIVSHQLRTPITAMKGYASLLLEESYGKLNTEQKTPIEKIFYSAQRLATMVTDFLDISKIEQGTMTYIFSRVDVGNMLTELRAEFLKEAEIRQLTIEFTTTPQSGSFIVFADEGKIRQCFSNILDNAIKYTPKGGITISLEKDDMKGIILCRIKDTGIGLSQEDIHHLFGKFTRGTEGQRHNTDGSGIGLYVAKKMIEAQHGHVWIDSEGPGKGSTFVVELSMNEEASEAQNQ